MENETTELKVKMRHPHTGDIVEVLVADLTPWMVKGYQQVKEPEHGTGE